MSERNLQNEIIDQLNGLPDDKQRQVLDFVRKLAQPAGKPGRAFLPFGGAIDTEDLSAMAEAIEEGCEQINTDEW